MLANLQFQILEAAVVFDFDSRETHNVPFCFTDVFDGLTNILQFR